MKNQKFEGIVFFIALALYTTTAWFSNGYHHADEHYQIIEFAQLKTGANQPADLAWEFHEKIRSSIQPAITMIALKSFHFFSITSPFIQAFFLRLTTALVALFAIAFFCRSCKSIVKPDLWNFFYALSFFLWFLPFINVRFSAETYSGLFSLLALGVLIRNPNRAKEFFFCGLLLGISFLFRFQLITVSAGIILWLFLIKKEQTKNIFYLLLAFLLVALIGALIDSWFYNELVFTPWNYFYANIVKDAASGFGTSPWFYYVYYIFRYAFFPFGTIIILGFLSLLFKQPKHLLIWAIIPFLLLHSLIPHKEVRFLFPLVNLVPVLLILAWQEINLPSRSARLPKIIIQVVFLFLIVINVGGMLASSLKPAGNGQIELARKISAFSTGKNIRLISANGSNPYDPWNGLVARFYLDAGIKNEKFSLLNVTEEQEKNARIFWTFKRKDLDNHTIREYISKQNLVLIAESIPPWMNGLLNIYGGFDTGEILLLYEKK